MDKQAPEVIYLQLDGDGGEEYSEDSATWSADRIHESDIDYIRADLVDLIMSEASEENEEKELIDEEPTKS